MHREARIANYVLTALSLAALIMLSLPLSAPVLAFKTCLGYLIDPGVYYGQRGVERLALAPARARELLSADMDNRRLKEELRQAAWLRAEADSLRQENRRLRAELGLAAPGGRDFVWARVMERDPLHWHRSFMVDAGHDRGVALNAPVLGARGESLAVVGRIVEVRPKSALVLLVTDELSSVAAALSLSGQEGLVQGQGGARLLMNYLSLQAAPQIGEAVAASATSPTFPEGVVVGTVARVFPRDAFLTFQSVEVAPAVEVSTLKEVMILKTGPLRREAGP